jgi:hypothetical protein
MNVFDDNKLAPTATFTGIRFRCTTSERMGRWVEKMRNKQQLKLPFIIIVEERSQVFFCNEATDLLSTERCEFCLLLAKLITKTTSPL